MELHKVVNDLRSERNVLRRDNNPSRLSTGFTGIIRLRVNQVGIDRRSISSGQGVLTRWYAAISFLKGLKSGYGESMR